MHNLQGAIELINDFNLKNERFFSFLPLSHSYERMAGLYFPILIGAEIYFCSTTDKLLSEIKEVKPTILSAVPRLYENIFKKIKFQINKTNFLVSYLLKKTFLLIENNPKENINFFEKFLVTIFLKYILKKKGFTDFWEKNKSFNIWWSSTKPRCRYFF